MHALAALSAVAWFVSASHALSWQPLAFDHPSIVPAAFLDRQRDAAAWHQYMQSVRPALRKILCSQNDATHHFKAFMRDREKGQAVKQALVVEIWIAATAKIERIEVEWLDMDAARVLTPVLVGQDLGVPPPSDMRQPFPLRFTHASPGSPNPCAEFLKDLPSQHAS